MAVIPTREKRTTRQQFSQNASHSPNVNSLGKFQGGPREGTFQTDLGVHFEGKHDLWRPIPPRCDVLGHYADFFPSWDRGFDGSGQAEVAHFEVAIGIEKKVSRLQVAVDDVGAMDRFEGAQDLVDEVLCGTGQLSS